MFHLNDVTSFLTIVGSLTPFVGVGYYFGRLEKRLSTNEKNIVSIKKDVNNLKESLEVLHV